MSIERFQIQVPDAVLSDLRYRLGHTRFPEASVGNGWERGADLSYMRSLVSYWIDSFDWRKKEAEINRLTQYRCHIDGVDLHFVYEKGKGKNPIPLILTHGWPDSFLRYQKVIPMLTDPLEYGADPALSFDVIVPSLPGFGFSGLPKEGGIQNARVAVLWEKLMVEVLGYPKFAAAGGDIGSGVTRYLAKQCPERLYGIHLSDIGIIRPLLTAPRKSLSQEEAAYQENAAKWMAEEGGYLSLQSTRPATLAYALSDSPIGTAAWILEKFRAWSDCDGDLSRRYTQDELLANVMLYWVSGTIGSSVQIYYENSHALPPLGRIDVPTGIAVFPGDILPPPRGWAEQNLNIVHWSNMQKGGHFTAMEEPALFADDIRGFFQSLKQA